MGKKTVETTIRNLMIEEFEIEEQKIHSEALLKEDMGIESLDVVDLLVLIESNFGLKIKTEEIKKIDTFGKFCDYVYEKTNQ